MGLLENLDECPFSDNSFTAFLSLLKTSRSKSDEFICLSS